MTEAARAQVTALLEKHRAGDADALKDLIAAVYPHLRRIASRQLAGARPQQTLNTTALVHEAYLKLAGSNAVAAHDREHFFAVAARAMRQLVVDHARARGAGKRGGDLARVTLDTGAGKVVHEADAMIALDDALSRLSELNDRLTHIVECRYFAGLTETETADALNLSRATVQRDWVKARAFLQQQLS